MNCEMCGKETSALYKANIEGVMMRVCEACARYGKVIETPKVEIKRKAVKQAEPRIVQPSTIMPKEEHMEVVVPDYAEKIRKARENMGLTQEDFAKKINEKESQVHKMETGTAVPSLPTAKKLEKILHTKLTEDYVERQNATGRSEDEGITLGDMIKTRTK